MFWAWSVLRLILLPGATGARKPTSRDHVQPLAAQIGLQGGDGDPVARALRRGAPGPAEEPHPDPGAEARHLGPDRTEADDPQGLAAQLDPPEDPRLPAARADAQEGGADVTRETEDEPEGVLGHRGGAVVGGMGDSDAAPPGLGHVDVGRVADAEKADEAEPRALAEPLGVHDRVVEEHRLGRPEAVDQLGPIPGGTRVVARRPQPPERLH